MRTTLIRLHFSIVIPAAMLVPLNAFSGEPEDTLRTYRFDPVVVTATNLEVLRNSVPTAVSVVTRRDILASGESSILAVLNKQVPGLFVTERGVLGYGVAQGAAGGITIRGAGGSPTTEVLVLTDGRPQMMGLMGHPLADTYVTGGVERVEVIRGPASLVHGTNAMAGVLNIITRKRLDPGFGYDLHSAISTFNTQKSEANLGYGFGNSSLALSVSRYSTDGSRPYSSFNINNGSLRGSAMLSDALTLSADASISGFRTYDPGTARKPLVNNWVDITRGSSGLALENRFGAVQGALKAFINFGRHDIYDGFHSTDNNVGVMLYQGFAPVEGNTMTLGVDYKRYGGQAENRKTNFVWGRFYVDEYGAYLITQQSLLADLITVSGGLRYNHHKLYGNELAPQIGAATRVTPTTTFRLSASKGFRSPTIRELYLFPAPTPTLQPERAWNYEAGFQQTAGEHWSFELTGYDQRGSNLIRVGGAFPNLKLSNSGEYTHKGVEFASMFKSRNGTELAVNYSYLDPGEQTMASPRHKVYLGGSVRLAPVTLQAGMQFVGRLFGDDFNRKPLPDYTLLDARISVAPWDYFSISLAGENLLDRQYQNLADYPMPGTTVSLGISLSSPE